MKEHTVIHTMSTTYRYHLGFIFLVCFQGWISFGRHFGLDRYLGRSRGWQGLQRPELKVNSIGAKMLARPTIPTISTVPWWASAAGKRVHQGGGNDDDVFICRRHAKLQKLGYTRGASEGYAPELQQQTKISKPWEQTRKHALLMIKWVPAIKKL